MNNFKIKKEVLLLWLNKGNVIERCSEPGPAFGKFSGIEHCPISGLETVINRLFRDGELSYKTFLSLGMRWDRYYPVNINGECHE